MISGRRILTNAHCVDHHTQVSLTPAGQAADLAIRQLLHRA